MEQPLLLIIGSLLSALATVLIFQFKGIREDLQKMSYSVEKLNKQIAVVFNNQDWHKEEIQELKERLDALET